MIESTAPSWISQLPHVNAALNSLATLCLVAGYVMIRQRRIAVHRALMIAAVACSALFLASYLTYHFYAGSVKYQGTGALRTFYFTVLITHSVLAAFVPFLALWTLYRALRGRFEQHRKIARWTLPIWLYVSVTGVMVYWMLYQM